MGEMAKAAASPRAKNAASPQVQKGKRRVRADLNDKAISKSSGLPTFESEAMFQACIRKYIEESKEEDDKNKEEMLAHGHGASNALKQLLAHCVKIGAHGNVHEISDYLRDQIYAAEKECAFGEAYRRSVGLQQQLSQKLQSSIEPQKAVKSPKRPKNEGMPKRPTWEDLLEYLSKTPDITSTSAEGKVALRKRTDTEIAQQSKYEIDVFENLDDLVQVTRRGAAMQFVQTNAWQEAVRRVNDTMRGVGPEDIEKELADLKKVYRTGRRHIVDDYNRTMGFSQRASRRLSHFGQEVGRRLSKVVTWYQTLRPSDDAAMRRSTTQPPLSPSSFASARMSMLSTRSSVLSDWPVDERQGANVRRSVREAVKGFYEAWTGKRSKDKTSPNATLRVSPRVAPAAKENEQEEFVGSPKTVTFNVNEPKVTSQPTLSPSHRGVDTDTVVTMEQSFNDLETTRSPKQSLAFTGGSSCSGSSDARQNIVGDKAAMATLRKEIRSYQRTIAKKPRRRKGDVYRGYDISIVTGEVSKAPTNWTVLGQHKRAKVSPSETLKTPEALRPSETVKPTTASRRDVEKKSTGRGKQRRGQQADGNSNIHVETNRGKPKQHKAAAKILSMLGPSPAARAIVSEFYMTEQTNTDQAMNEKRFGCLGQGIEVIDFEDMDFAAAARDGNLEYLNVILMHRKTHAEYAKRIPMDSRTMDGHTAFHAAFLEVLRLEEELRKQVQESRTLKEHNPSKTLKSRATDIKQFDLILSLLFHNGADINKLQSGGKAVDCHAPIHDAASQRNHARMNYLINLGADINVATTITSMTPLMMAAASGCSETVAVLLSQKSDLDKLDADGRTALHHAAMSGDIKTVRTLILAGCDKQVVSLAGRTAAQEAKALDRMDIYTIIMSFETGAYRPGRLLDHLALMHENQTGESLLPRERPQAAPSVQPRTRRKTPLSSSLSATSWAALKIQT